MPILYQLKTLQGLRPRPFKKLSLYFFRVISIGEGVGSEKKNEIVRFLPFNKRELYFIDELSYSDSIGTQCFLKTFPHSWSTTKSRMALTWPTNLTSDRDHLCIVITVSSLKPIGLKLYCGFIYTRPCKINRILGLKQLWLQVNGHAWFHLHGIHWAARYRLGLKKSKWKYVSSRIRTHATLCQNRWNSALDRSATMPWW